MKVVRVVELDTDENTILDIIECEVKESTLKRKELPARIKRFVAEVILKGNTARIIVK